MLLICIRLVALVPICKYDSAGYRTMPVELEARLSLENEPLLNTAIPNCFLVERWYESSYPVRN